MLPVPHSTRRYPLAVPFWTVCATRRTRHTAWSWPLTWLPWCPSLVPVILSYLHLLCHPTALPSPVSLRLLHQSSNMVVPAALGSLCHTVASLYVSPFVLPFHPLSSLCPHFFGEGEGRTAVLCCGPAAVGLRLLRSSLSLLQRPKLPAAAGSELFIVLYHLAGPLWWPCSLLQWLAANSYDSVPLLICHPHLITLNILSSPSLTFLPFQIAPTRLESNIE